MIKMNPGTKSYKFTHADIDIKMFTGKFMRVE